ncbi:MAG: hypothetical protein QW404_02905 [Candidatus Nanoarchaeia archaeon]
MPLERFLTSDEKIIEVDLTKNIKEGDQLFIIGKQIYLHPTVERTDSGFKMFGTPIDYLLPLFTIEIDFEKKKVSATIKGDEVPLKCRYQIEEVLREYF